MKTRRLLLFVTILLSTCLLGGCTMFNTRDEGLPEGRNVKTVEFPVRHLTYSDIKSRQEYEDLTLSGTITNASPYKLTDVGVKILIFLAEGSAPHQISPFGTPPPQDDPSPTTLKVSVLATPSTILPHDSATFEMRAEVDRPVARMEIHGFWNKAD